MCRNARWTAAVAVSVILAGCSQPTKPVPVGLAKGDIAPEIQGQDSDGKPFRLTDYRGKVVVLDFWATW
jgi:cytochrome oxidase Cu insertion factor (SCO1/SenC/PrrC family)